MQRGGRGRRWRGGAAGLAAAPLRRQSRRRRAERWRRRLPLLDEDLGEEELPHLVPGEEARQPIELTPLGACGLVSGWWGIASTT